MLLNNLKSQFGHPKGVLGSLVGNVMAKNNRTRVDWAVDAIKTQPQDRILEVGFGPGIAVQQLADQVPQGKVIGLDISKTMLRQATRRNLKHILAGRVQLNQGSVADLGLQINYFTKVLAINTLHHWEKPVEDRLTNLFGTLKSEGTINIFEQPRWAKNEEQVQDAASEIAILLFTAGFSRLQILTQPMKPVTCIYVRGTKP